MLSKSTHMEIFGILSFYFVSVWFLDVAFVMSELKAKLLNLIDCFKKDY